VVVSQQSAQQQIQVFVEASVSAFALFSIERCPWFRVRCGLNPARSQPLLFTYSQPPSNRTDGLAAVWSWQETSETLCETGATFLGKATATPASADWRMYVTPHRLGEQRFLRQMLSRCLLCFAELHGMGIWILQKSHRLSFTWTPQAGQRKGGEASRRSGYSRQKATSATHWAEECRILSALHPQLASTAALLLCSQLWWGTAHV